MSRTNFALIGNNDRITNLSVKKWVFFSLGRYLIEIESNYKDVIFFHMLFRSHTVMRES